MGLRVGSLVKYKPKKDVSEHRVGLVVEMDAMGMFIMNYRVRWSGVIGVGNVDQMWFRDHELEAIN